MGPLGELWRLGSREGMWQSPKRQMSDSLGAAPLAQFAPASLTSTPPGTGAGMETEEVHCSCKDLEISRTYGSTQASTSWLLRERLVYGAPWCTHNRKYFDNYSIFSLVVERASSMDFHVEWPPAYHDGRRSAYSLTNSWASNRFNLHERSVQLNLHERLRALDLRVLHSPCLR